jgi:putative spermidine/putrescine transport system permease protein
MRHRGRFVWWIVFALAAIYFLLPLVATLDWSLKAKPFGAAWTNALSDPKLWRGLMFSFVAGIATIIAGVVLILPTAYWVRLKVPKARPIVELITLLPFVIPAVVLVFGLIRAYSKPPISLTTTDMGTNFLLVAGYVVLSLPYLYRSIDTGLRAVDIQSLTEAAQSLGAGWPTVIVRVILPNVRVAILSGAFLTLAIVMGEFTIANYLGRTQAFGPYLSVLGNNKSYEPAAVALISFGLTWLAMGMIAVIGRGSRSRITVGGAR